MKESRIFYLILTLFLALILQKKYSENKMCHGHYVSFICNNKELLCIYYYYCHKTVALNVFKGFVKTKDTDPSQVLTLQSLLMLTVLQLQCKVNMTIHVSKYYTYVEIWSILWYFCLGCISK